MNPEHPIIHQPTGLGDLASGAVDIGGDALDAITDDSVGDLLSGAADIAGSAAEGALDVIGGILGSIFD